MVHGEEPVSLSRTSSRDSQVCSWQGVQDHQSTAGWQLHWLSYHTNLWECDVDLFATWLLSWISLWVEDQIRMDKRCIVTLMSKWMACALPPFSNQQMSQKIREEEVSLVLVWRSQPWYPTLLELLTKIPLILPDGIELLIVHFGNPHSLVASGQLQLAPWKLSGKWPAVYT